jgi:hypothetical protein
MLAQAMRLLDEIAEEAHSNGNSWNEGCWLPRIYGELVEILNKLAAA